MTSKLIWLALLGASPLAAAVVTVINPGPDAPSVSLTWAQIDATLDTWVFRRTLPTGGEAESAYEPLARVAAPGTSFTDTTAATGRSYSYIFAVGVEMPMGAGSFFGLANYGYHAVANLAPAAIEHRGTVLLVVEDTIGENGELAQEIGLLEMDLAGDGWAVQTMEFARHGVGDHRDLKAAIVAARAADPTINALYLFGRLPVARSGMMGPDGHTPYRAHETDHYYADIDGNWTDTTVNVAANGSIENENIPGDGKFDQNHLPSPVELMTGRVDLSNLNSFRKTEHEMMLGYIHKAHAWRHALRPVPRRASWNSGYLRVERNNLVTIFGESNVVDAEFQPLLNTEPQVWAMDFGPAGGKHSTYLLSEHRAIFMLNFGSWKQMWKRANNPMRNLLAQPDWGLTAAWGARPSLDFYHMTAGLPVGYAFRDTQNRRFLGTMSWYAGDDFYQLNTGFHHAELVNGLMGDPTLRLDPVPPPRSLAATVNGSATLLTWTPPADGARVGFHVYRSTQRLGVYERLNAEMLAADAAGYTDPERPAGDVYYQVRAVSRTETPAGAYLNPSQAAFARVRADGVANRAPVATPGLVIEAGSNVPTEVRFAGTDADGDELIPVVVANPSHGVLRWNHGKVFYVSNLNYTGIDTFTYRLFDGVAFSEPVIATVDVASARPDVLLSWQFGLSGNGESTHARAGVAPASLSIGPGLKTSTYAQAVADAFYVTTATSASLDLNDWIEWTVAPASPSQRLSIERIVFSSFAVSFSPVADYLTQRLELRASADDFATHLTLPLDQPELALNNTTLGSTAADAIMGNGRYFSVTLPDRPEFRDTAAPVRFRLYIWNTATGTGIGKSGDRDFQSAADLVVFGQTHAASDTYAAWAEAIDWGEHGPDAAEPDADVDGDGLPNVLEYALGLDPLVADGVNAVAVSLDGAGGRLTLSFERHARIDLTYAVEASDDLATGEWETIYTSTGVENIEGTVTVVDPVPLAERARRFLRLRVEML